MCFAPFSWIAERKPPKSVAAFPVKHNTVRLLFSSIELIITRNLNDAAQLRRGPDRGRFIVGPGDYIRNVKSPSSIRSGHRGPSCRPLCRPILFPWPRPVGPQRALLQEAALPADM
jgi:hypothetical protein